VCPILIAGPMCRHKGGQASANGLPIVGVSGYFSRG
jgi:hypothetical protein